MVPHHSDSNDDNDKLELQDNMYHDVDRNSITDTNEIDILNTYENIPPQDTPTTINDSTTHHTSSSVHIPTDDNQEYPQSTHKKHNPIHMTCTLLLDSQEDHDEQDSEYDDHQLGHEHQEDKYESHISDSNKDDDQEDGVGRQICVDDDQNGADARNDDSDSHYAVDSPHDGKDDAAGCIEKSSCSFSGDPSEEAPSNVDMASTSSSASSAHSLPSSHYFTDRTGGSGGAAKSSGTISSSSGLIKPYQPPPSASPPLDSTSGEPMTTVVYHHPGSHQQSRHHHGGGGRRDPDEGKIFVGGLSWDTTDDSLNAYFGKFGRIIDSVVMKNIDGKTRGFAFVTFDDPVVVDVIMSQVHVIDGKRVDPKPAIPRDAQYRSEKMFVGSLSMDTTEEDLRKYFSSYGMVLSATLMFDQDTNISRGFGFVTFQSAQDLSNALSCQPHHLKGAQIETTRAVPKTKQPSSTSVMDFMGMGKMMASHSSTAANRTPLNAYRPPYATAAPYPSMHSAYASSVRGASAPYGNAPSYSTASYPAAGQSVPSSYYPTSNQTPAALAAAYQSYQKYPSPAQVSSPYMSRGAVPQHPSSAPYYYYAHQQPQPGAPPGAYMQGHPQSYASPGGNMCTCVRVYLFIMYNAKYCHGIFIT